MNANLLVRINAVLNRISRSYSQLPALLFFLFMAIGFDASADDQVIIKITDPAPVCFPQTVDLTAPAIFAGSSTDLSYTYYSDMAMTNVIANPNAVGAGIYYVKGVRSSSFGMAATSIIVKVDPVTEGGTIASSQTICFGNSVSLVLNGYTGKIIKWQKSSDIGFTSPTDINVTSPTLSSATIGILKTNTYFRAFVKSGSCSSAYSSTALVTVTPLVGIPAAITPSASTICQGSANTTYTTSATNATSYTWTVTGSGNTISGTGPTGTVTWAAGFTGKATISVTANGCNGSKATVSTTVTVTPTVGDPVFALGSTSTRCQGAGTVIYNATSTNSTGISYSLDAASVAGGNSIISSTGAVTYVAGWSGPSTIKASAVGCNSSKIAIHTVTTTPTVGTPAVPTPSSTIICQGSTNTIYTTSATNATSYTWSVTGAGNTISGTGTIGTVAWSSGFSGQATISVTANGCNGPSASASTTVTVTPTVGVPVFTLGSTSTRCQGPGTVTYTATSTNSTGIIYSLDAASLTGGNSIISSTGAVTYATGWSGKSTITASASGCGGPQTVKHEVTTTPTVGKPDVPTSLTTTICQGSNTIYTTSATNATSYNWSVTGSGNTISGTGKTGTVTWAAGFSGQATISVTANGCNGPSAIASTTVTVTPTVGVPVFTLGLASTRCQGSGTVTYTATSTNSTGISYSLDAASLTGGNSIVSSTGTVTYVAGWSGESTITASAAGCGGPQTAKHKVTVTRTVGVPVFTLGSRSTRCQGSGTVTYTATSANSTGISYSLDAVSRAGGNSIVSSTGAVTYVAGWSGPSTITASAVGCNSSQTAIHTVITNLPVGLPSTPTPSATTICQGSTNTTYTTSATNATSYTWSVTGAGNTISGTGTTGTVTWSAGFSGQATISVTANGCNGPSASVSTTVTVTPTVTVPVFTLGSTSTRCQGSETVTYGATSTNSTGIIYSLDAASVTGGNSIASSTGAVTYAAGWSGESTITASADGCGGPKKATHTVTITPTVGVPVFIHGSASTRCQGSGTITYTVISANSTGISYSLDAASVAGGNSIISSTGAVTYVAGWSGPSTIKASAVGCNSSKIAIHTVTTTPTAGTPAIPTPSATTICQGSTNTIYSTSAANATSYNWSVTGAGNTISGTGTTGTVAWSAGFFGQATISVTANGCNGPSASVSTTVTVTPTVTVPVFTLGSTSTRCQGSETVTYGATSTNSSGIIYSLDAASVTGGNSIASSTGAVTYAAGWSGESTITASASGCAGPKTAAHIVVTNLPVGLPSTPTPSATTICQGSTNTTYTTSATNVTSYTWSVTGAGNTISGTGTTGTVAWSAGFFGQATISVTANGCNGPSASASTTVTVTPAPTAGISYVAPLCSDDLTTHPVILTGSRGGIFSAPAGLSIDPSSGAIAPGLSTPAAYTVSYSIAASGGCPAYITSTQVQIGNIPVLETIVVKNVTCKGSNDGALTEKAIGTDTFSYDWSGPSSYVNTGSSISGLSPGVYVVKVTNSSGCSQTGSATVAESALPLTITLTGTNASKAGALNGTVNTTIAGGTMPYSCQWAGPGSFTSIEKDITGLKYGSYHLIVTDSYGCIKEGLYVVKDPPTANDDSANTIEDIPVSISVISNDTDADGTIDPSTVDLDPLTDGIQTTFSVANKGVFSTSSAGEVNFQPVSHFVGSVVIQYVVSDNDGLISNVANISVNVLVGNKPPIGVDDNITIAEDNTISGNLFDNDIDPEGKALTLVSFTLGSITYTPQSNVTINDVGTLLINLDGTFTFVPHENYFGIVPQVSYKVADVGGLTATANLNITVTPVNDPPVAVADNLETKENTKLEANILNNDYDIEGDAISLDVIPIKPPTHGTLVLSPNGDIIYQPVIDFMGSDSFTYQICDNGDPSLCSNAIVTIQVVKDANCDVFVPNIYTPNGDGVHDYFKIRCLYNYENPVIQIFSRNGNLIFKKDHYGNLDFWGSEDQAFWNGRSENKMNLINGELPVGTYYYILKLGDGKVLTGFIYLGK